MIGNYIEFSQALANKENLNPNEFEDLINYFANMSAEDFEKYSKEHAQANRDLTSELAGVFLLEAESEYYESANPDEALEVDPELADLMGALPEDAINFDDIQLSLNIAA